MASPTPVKRKLSKNLTGMKFMQRGSIDGEDIVEVSSRGGLIKKWVVPNIPVVDNVVDRANTLKFTDSFVECENLNRLGRFSYNKFNKDIEKLSERYVRQGGVLDEDTDEEEATVSVQEMVTRYENITSKRLLGKHGRSLDDDLESPGYDSEPKGRHKLLQKRVSKMDKQGFLRPS